MIGKDLVSIGKLKYWEGLVSIGEVLTSIERLRSIGKYC